jgi:superfamily II DNA or RNA helicase
MKTLRADQTETIADVRAAMRETRRVIVQGPTGSGKTVIMADIVSKAREKDKKVLVTVPAISLVDQTVIAFAAQGIMDVGVIQASHPMTDWSRPVQVASIQTLQNRWRDKKMPEADVVLVDEVHRRFDLFSHWLVDPKWKKIPFIGFSATPWSKGLGLLYEKLLVANTIAKLIAGKVLVPFRTFAPDVPNLTGVRSQSDVNGTSDFVAADLDEVMRPRKLVANIVETWREVANGRPTVCFCCSRAHAEQVQKEFEAAGVGSAYLDCDTPLADRNEVRRRMLRGEVEVVTNCEVIGLGVDWPEVSCIIYARPTMSDIRFVQNIGRGLRAAEGKEDLLILDHSSTTLRLGFVDEVYNFHNGLDDGKLKPENVQVVLLPKECPQCHLLKPPRTAVCPHCGHKCEAHAKQVAVERGTLRELKPTDDMEAWRKKLPDKPHVFGQLWWFGKKKGYKPAWAAVKTREIFGSYPRAREPEPETIGMPVPELVSYLYYANEKFKRDKYNERRREAAHRTNGNVREEAQPKGAVASVEQVARQFTPNTLMSSEDWEDFR